MAFTAVYSLSPEVLSVRRPTYFWFWICSQPLEWLLDILVVREICQVVLERHPGLFTLGRWVMYAGVGVASFVSFLSLLPHIDSTMPARSKAVDTGLQPAADQFQPGNFPDSDAFRREPLPRRLSRNVILNAVLFTSCFLCESLRAILTTMFDVRMNPWVSAALLAAEAACLLLWFFRLDSRRRAGSV